MPLFNVTADYAEGQMGYLESWFVVAPSRGAAADLFPKATALHIHDTSWEWLETEALSSGRLHANRHEATAEMVVKAARNVLVVHKWLLDLRDKIAEKEANGGTMLIDVDHVVDSILDAPLLSDNCTAAG